MRPGGRLEIVRVGGLSAAKTQALDSLIRTMADGVLNALRAALASEAPGSWSDPVRVSVENEVADRRLRNQVLRELVALSRPSGAAPAAYPVSPTAAAIVWSGVKAVAPDKVSLAAELFAARDYERFQPVSLQLLLAAGEALDAGVGPLAAILQRLEPGPGGAERVKRVVHLSPIVRAHVGRTRAWLKTGGAEEANALRLALRDASALCDEGGPLFIDMLAAQFEERWTALRLVSAVMDRPKEGFLAASELAGFAEAVLDAIDGALVTLGRLKDGSGQEAGNAAAAATELAVEGLGELDHWVQLDPQQSWGRRVAALRRSVSQAAQARLKEADGVVARALPVQPVRGGGKILRGAPDLQTPFDPLAMRRAEASLAYVSETRRAATSGGFTGLRTKVVEALDTRISTYAEDLFELMRSADPAESAEARARLPAVADFLGMVREPDAAQLLRRRLAAA